MKNICIYHTRSGISKQIAEQIAAEIGAEVMEVTDGISRKGFFGYIGAAVTGLKKTLPVLLPYTLPRPLEEYDKVIIAAPIWCENVSPVMRAFLAQNKNRFSGELYYVIGSMSDFPYQPKINALRELTGKPCTDFLQVKTHKTDWHNEVSSFAAKIKAQ